MGMDSQMTDRFLNKAWKAAVLFVVVVVIVAAAVGGGLVWLSMSFS